MAEIKRFVSNQEKLDTMREEHGKYNEELDHMIRQNELKLNNGGVVTEQDVDRMLDLMKIMTDDRREINKQAVKCGEKDMYNNSQVAQFEGILDDIL